MWSIYWIDVLDSVGTYLRVIAGLVLFFVVLGVVGLATGDFPEAESKKAGRALTYGTVLGLAFVFVSLFIPSKPTLQAMKSAYEKPAPKEHTCTGFLTK